MTTTAVLGYNTIMDVVNEYTSMDAYAMHLEAAKVLHRLIPLMKMLPMEKSNQIMSHIGVRESYLPTPGTRRFNEVIAPTASHSTPFSEPIAMFADYSEVDAALWKIQSEPNKWRAGKDEKKIHAMGQKVEYELIYGTISTDPGSFNGLARRANTLTTYPNGDSTWEYNTYGGGGTGSDTTSIFLMELGPGKIYATYPANLPAGLNVKDLGEQTKESSGSYMQVLRTYFELFLGLVIEDERCFMRYANIESSGSSNIFDPEALITLKNRLPGSGEAPGTVVMCNRRIKTQMEIAAMNKTNAYYTIDDLNGAGAVFGGPVLKFHGMPVIVNEKIVNTETAIS